MEGEVNVSSKAQIAKQLLIFATQLVTEVEEEGGDGAATIINRVPSDLSDDDDGINVSRCAKLVGISEDQIYRLVETDQIPYYRIPPTRGKGESKGDIRFIPSQVKSWRANSNSNSKSK